MASPDDLKEVLRETLESRGVLGAIKGRIRAEVYSALDDKSEPKPALSNENILINELIREYLDFNKYNYTASVLVSESGMSKAPLDREFLRNELNVVEEGPAKSVPLLYSIVGSYVNGSHPRGRPQTDSQSHHSHSHRQPHRVAFTELIPEPENHHGTVIVEGRRY